MSGPGAVTATWKPGDRCLQLGDDAGGLALELSFVLPGRDVTADEADEGDLLVVHSDALRMRLRVAENGRGQTVQLVVDNRTPEPVDTSALEVDLDASADHAGWCWASGPHAVVSALRTSGVRSGVLVRLRTGFAQRPEVGVAFEHPTSSRSLAPTPAEAGSGGTSLRLAVPGAPLPAYGRLVCQLEVTCDADLSAYAEALPAWLPPTVVEAGEAIEIREPDRAIVAGRDVHITDSDTDAALTAQPGHHLVSIHGPRGVDRLTLTWAPAADDVLAAAAAAALRGRPSRASDAAGFVVAEALARGLADEGALDWAESVDWLDRGSLLGDAAAGVLAALTRERIAWDEVWRQLEFRPLTAGFGLVVARLGAGALGAFGTPPPTHGLLSRTGPDPDLAVELALLRTGNASPWTEELQGMVTILGGGLPGRPLGLAGVRAAYLSSVLRLTPESWVGRRAALAAAVATERLLLTDYAAYPEAPASGRVPVDALAWLSLGRLGC